MSRKRVTPKQVAAMLTAAGSAKRISEKQFTRQVIQFAELRGWVCYHVPDSRRCTAVGFPDLVFRRHGVLVAAELKVGKNKATEDQKQWLRAFDNYCISDYVWTPNDWHEIEAVLS